MTVNAELLRGLVKKWRDECAEFAADPGYKNNLIRETIEHNIAELEAALTAAQGQGKDNG